MATSIITNWGKTFFEAAAMTALDTDGAALPSTFYIILISNAFTQFGTDVDPDIENISAITGAINPVGGTPYSGNGRNRSAASGGFKVTKDNSADRGVLEFFEPPVLTAGGSNIASARGYALVTANSISAGKVIAIQRFNQDYAIGANQTATLTGGQTIIA